MTAPYDNYTVDGQMYNKGDEVWDLGDWTCTEIHEDGKRDYTGEGTADENNLPPYAPAGSTAYNPESGKAYVKAIKAWHEA